MPSPSFTEIVWHPTILGDAADSVPDLIENTNGLVERFLDKNQEWAQASIDQAYITLQQLSNASFRDEFPDPPNAPSIVATANLSGALGTGTVNIGDLVPEYVGPFIPDTVVVPDFTGVVPEYVPTILGLSIPEAPIFATPQAPTPPGLDLTFNVGTPPEKDYGVIPTLAELNLPEYVPPILPLFNDTEPEFDTLPPSPIIQWVEPEYHSDVQDAIKAVLLEMLAGGTGLPVDVEQALWERARQREDAGTLKAVSEATDQWASRGFQHPPGQLNGQTLAVREEGHRKANELSREIMVKQADLEQTNRNFAVEKGISYEQVYVGIFLAIVERNFQIAKFTVETTIQIFNMMVTVFNVRQAIFAQKIELFKVRLEVALAPLKVFTALVEAEKAKAQMNEALVNAYKAKVEAYGKQVDAFKALVEAEVARASQQKLKVDIFKAEIDAMVGEVNLQRGIFEAYGERVRGETAKAGLEEANARVFGSRVQAFGILSEQGFKQAEVSMANSKLKLDWAVANLNRVSTLNGQQLNVIQARLAGSQASLGRQTAEFQSSLAVRQAGLQATMELSRLGIAKYTALLEQWKTRGTQILALAQMQSESLRAAGQMASTLASGAMAGTHVSAGISAGASSSQSRSDNKSESKSFAQGVIDSASQTVSHSYNHNEPIVS